MPVICPNCSHSFDPTPPPPERKKFKLPVSWRTILSLIVLVFFGSIVYQYVQEIDTKHLVSSVTTLQSNLQKAYEVFDQISTNVQGRVARQIRVKVASNDVGLITEQAKKLIAAEKGNKPTNLIYIYFYVTDKDVSTIPLDHWYAKVTYVNFTLIRDLSPGDFQGFKNIAPGTYLEIKN
ncbi:MAG: hypothetical protein A2V81_02700 [Candidatus Abawacabacteria bacterium RBG_16_42_10]|uniref:Uncharacterized protein n=1 Tax=Candidatus Abawacabacteria bacterium RBG_16_42_10 TaxID=1817814 RepID=A0A1F4XK95_9BACT|nr:MAG: hypothetical protein A2V81_02700 [Candidatus Abawacabacteria bacterium RBG_16_42_10]